MARSGKAFGTLTRSNPGELHPHRGSIWTIDYDPSVGREVNTRHFALCVSPTKLNTKGMAIFVHISSHEHPMDPNLTIFIPSDKERKVDGFIYWSQIRSLDWIGRQGKFVERCDAKLFEGVMNHILAIFDTDLDPK